MDFSQACQLSKLDSESVRYYVNEKLLMPLFPTRPLPELAEYSEEDVVALAGIANLRRLRLPIEQIRKLLYDRNLAATLTLKHYTFLKKETQEVHKALEQLDDLDLADVQTTQDFLRFFASFDLDLPLPDRDLNHDENAFLRKRMEDQEEQIETLQRSLLRSKRRHRRSLIALGFSLALLFLSLGYLLASYFYW